MNVTDYNEKNVSEGSDYWLKELSVGGIQSNIPYDYQAMTGQHFQSEELDVKLPDSVAAKLCKLSNASDRNLMMSLIAAWCVVIHKKANHNQLKVGVPAYDMTQVGNGDNAILPVGVCFDDNTTYKSLLLQLKDKITKSNQHKDALKKVLEDVGGLSEIIDCIISFQNVNTYQENDDCYVNMYLAISKKDQEITVKFKYNAKVYHKMTIERSMEHYLHTLEDMTSNINNEIRYAKLMSATETNRILTQFSKNKDFVDTATTIVELFEEQAKKNPDCRAVVYGNKALTYRELNEKSNYLASILRDKVDKKNHNVVAIMTSRSLEMMVGVMGILKAGAAYLSIDLEFPEERIKYMLSDSNISTLIVQQDFENSIGFDGNIIRIDQRVMESMNTPNPERISTAKDLAYVIYTSGTTGKPKGVMIEQGSVVNLVYGLKDAVYSMYGPNLKVCLMAPYFFDASVQQIFGALLQGHTLVIAPDKIRKDSKSILQFYEENAIDISDGTPSMLKIIIYPLENEMREIYVKHFIIGGEVLPYSTVERFYHIFQQSKPLITNVYGPTECCVDATSILLDPVRISESKIISIGSGLLNVGTYILGNELEVLPIGAIGELYISGAGLARGYMNNSVQTKERFILNPYEDGKLMYKTGDMVKWLPDGTIQFIGRVDNQVKIRGYRVEIEDIESQLLSNIHIKDAVVVLQEDQYEEGYLAAYIVSDDTLDGDQIREYLLKKLPEYMIPSYLIKVDRIPLKQNGKVDKEALVSINNQEALIKVAKAEPQNNSEIKLSEIFKEILKIDQVDANTSFFDLGGHSLKALILISRIYKEFNVDIQIDTLFEQPTVRQLAEYIRKAKIEEYQEIEAVEESIYYDLSPMQKRVFILDKVRKVNYNMPGGIVIEGNIDEQRIEESFCKLVQRHEALRTSFQIVDGAPVQIIHKEVDFHVDHRNGMEDQIEEMEQAFIKQFDLSKAPLFRVLLIKVDRNKYYLLYDIHHIISDGVSMQILMREFTQIYNGDALTELRIQYKDYVAWQKKRLASKEMDKQRQYWLNQFAKDIPVLNLPTDYARESEQSFEGDIIEFYFTEELTSKLHKLASSTGCTMYMVLFAIYNIVLSKYSGQDDIVVGTAIVGRQHPDLENVVGMFLNTLAIRSYPRINDSFIDFLATIKRNILDAYDNQDFQFEELIDQLGISIDLSRNPLFDTMFIMQNIPKQDANTDSFSITPIMVGNYISKFDFKLEAFELKEVIKFSIDYCTKLYKIETMEDIVQAFTFVANEVVNKEKVTLAEIIATDDVVSRSMKQSFNEDLLDE